MVVYRLKLLTSDEEELIKRFMVEGTKFPELEEIWRNYNGPLTQCLDQLVGTITRRKLVSSRCPIEIFHKTLGDFVHKEIPTEDKIKFDLAQHLALENIFIEFICGFECPCCPATIMGEV